jgi:N-acetylglutamate synthase-like GNAT family acetyltransferase
MKEFNIVKVESLINYNLERLLIESEQEGYRFVRKLVDQYESGENRFQKAGEVLYVAVLDEEVVGVCGLNLDLYVQDDTLGRVRHLYVLTQCRNQGVGHLLF